MRNISETGARDEKEKSLRGEVKGTMDEETPKREGAQGNFYAEKKNGDDCGKAAKTVIYYKGQGKNWKRKGKKKVRASVQRANIKSTGKKTRYRGQRGKEGEAGEEKNEGSAKVRLKK